MLSGEPEVFGSSNRSDLILKQQMAAGDSLYSHHEYLASLETYTSILGNIDQCRDDSLYFQILGRIGQTYDACSDSWRALYYYGKVISDSRAEKYTSLMASIYVKTVIANCNVGNVRQARKFFEKQMEYPLQDSLLNLYFVNTNAGLIESQDENPVNALKYFRKILKICNDENLDSAYRDSFKAAALVEIAKAFSQTEYQDSSLLYWRRSVELAKSRNFTYYLAESYKGLSHYWRTKGDTDKSALYLDLYHEIADTLFSNRIDLASMRLLQEHDIIAKDQISSLNDTIRSRTIFLCVFIVLSLSLTGLVIYIIIQHRHKMDAYRLLIDKNENLHRLESCQFSQKISSSETDFSDDSSETFCDKVCPHPAIDDSDNARIESISSKSNTNLIDKINNAMNNVDLITDKNFSISVLAQYVGSNQKYVSGIINDVFNKNFRTLLNERLIYIATQWLVNEEEYGKVPIAEMAENLGYSSSSAFINTFKKHMGMTPAVYRKLRKEKS